MCVVSMIGDHFNQEWDKYRRPYIQPGTTSPADITNPFPNTQLADLSKITREEFDALKREVEMMKALLKRAKIYDEQNNEPDCEIEEKMAFLRKIAEFVGINLDDVIGKQENDNRNNKS